VDARSDIYALGLVAWYLLVGRPPFHSQSLGELLNDQMNTALPHAVAARPDLPPAVDDVLARLCAKDPAGRPAKMAEVAALFESLRPRVVTPAPLFTRGAAHLFDVTVAGVTGGVVALVLYALRMLIIDVIFPARKWLEDYDGAPIVVLASTAAMAAVLLLPEMWYRTTLGKVLFDLRVARADGTRPGVLALVGRLALRFPALFVMPLMIFDDLSAVAGLGAFTMQVIAAIAGLVCYFARNELTLSDIVTRTRVAPRRDVI
jgi:uncharacterized RDD family membrane protein YckC